MQSAQRNLLPDIRDMLLLSMTPAGVSNWMTSECIQLGMTPLNALEAGRYAEVYNLAMDLDQT